MFSTIASLVKGRGTTIVVEGFMPPLSKGGGPLAVEGFMTGGRVRRGGYYPPVWLNLLKYNWREPNVKRVDIIRPLG